MGDYHPECGDVFYYTVLGGTRYGPNMRVKDPERPSMFWIITATGLLFNLNPREIEEDRYVFYQEDTKEFMVKPI